MPSTSSEAAFTPRKEFIREPPNTPNSFSLLTISSSNCVRLYSFPAPVITTLRRLFEFRRIFAGFREDIAQNFYEFALDGKPWASSKSVSTERLLVEILTVVYHHGYSFLSTIDYGREHDDRLAITFARPVVQPNSRSDSPLPMSNISRTNLSDKSLGKRVPFALSFPSATFLRVIAPPLDSTPAILQAVRGAWPRGVLTEKKIGDNSFEFKLKGYKWFQEDTFATDSLRHILALLTSLDARSFSLVASISLTGRSRVKDLWIFTGPAPSSVDDVSFPDSPPPSTSNLTSSHGDLKRSPEPLSPVKSSSLPSTNLHKRLATDPVVRSPTSPSSPLATQHPRAATDGASFGSDARQSPTPPSSGSGSALSSSNVLRKLAPRAQLPVSVHDTDEHRPDFRVNLPSTVSEGAENMTGIGAGGPHLTPDVFYSTPPFAPSPGAQPKSVTEQEEFESTTKHPHSEDAAVDHGIEVASDNHSSPEPSRPGHRLVALNNTSSSSSGPGTPGTLQEVLSPHVFTTRDSTFSTNTEMSSEVPIPIKWTGVGRETDYNRESVIPEFPGAWQPTPIEERDDAQWRDDDRPLDVRLEQDKEPEQPLQDVVERVASPTMSDPDAEHVRKSEAGLVGMIAQTGSDSSPKTKNEKEKTESDGDGGKGWVLVNVEDQGKETSESSPRSPGAPTTESPAPLSPPSRADDARSPSPHPNASMSPAAKAIVIIDAVENKGKNKSKEEVAEPSRMRRFFSLSRKDSKKVAEDLEVVKGKTRAKPTLGDKLRRIGTPEAARRDGSRRSIDG